MHGLAVGVFFAMPWPLSARIALFAVLVVSLWRSLRSTEVTSIHLHENGTIKCIMSDGMSLSTTLLPDTTVFSWLVVLRMKANERKQAISLALFPDHMSHEEFRVLRLWLNWGQKMF